jgi:hypothetical protein
MTNESSTTTDPVLNALNQLENYAIDLARAILPKLEEFDAIWKLANSVCDRYMEPQAASPPHQTLPDDPHGDWPGSPIWLDRGGECPSFDPSGQTLVNHHCGAA